jgi:NADPH-dependent 2,4-dienoyl-CoA reductase/sulfur reductase-like enzyme
MTLERIAIIGGGLAALRAAERLRELAFTGTITMIGEESGPAYNRPPLSKQVLEHKMHTDKLGFATSVELDLDARYGVRATRLDPTTRQIELSDGSSVAYDGAIIATGVRTRKLGDGPLMDDRVLTLRTLPDAIALDRLMKRARRLLIVGGGFIGCEVASTARKRAVKVTIVDRAPYLLGRVVGPALGGLITTMHAEAGVDLRLGRAITKWNTSGRKVSALLDDGAQIDADAVLVAIGTIPNVDWLDDLGLDLSDGVLCDETSHVVGLDDVVAAGDVARWPNKRFGGPARRVEHWINAVEHGQAAAENLLLGREWAKPFAPIPRFWSEQHGVRIQAVGMPAIADRVALAEGSMESRQLVAVCLDDQRLVAAIALDSPRAMLRYAERLDQETAPLLTVAPAPMPVTVSVPEQGLVAAPVHALVLVSAEPMLVSAEPVLVAAPAQESVLVPVMSSADSAKPMTVSPEPIPVEAAATWATAEPAWATAVPASVVSQPPTLVPVAAVLNPVEHRRPHRRPLPPPHAPYQTHPPHPTHARARQLAPPRSSERITHRQPQPAAPRP